MKVLYPPKIVKNYTMRRKVFRYRQIDSTNSEASRLLSAGKIKGQTFVVADSQGRGKGRGDHSWSSEGGKNLLMSWIVQPAFLSVSAQFQLSKTVSLAITDLLVSFGLSSSIKWPNDILCHGRKIAGILIENRIVGEQLQHSIIGIGLNINQRDFPDFSTAATSMSLEANDEFSLPEIESRLMDLLERGYGELEHKAQKSTDTRYLQRLYMLNETCRFSDGESVFIGTIRGVDEKGQLLVETQKQIHGFGFHEISMVV